MSPHGESAGGDATFRSQPLPLENAVLWGPTSAGPPAPFEQPYPIFMHQMPLGQMIAHTRSAPAKTLLGFLLGELCECPETGIRYVVIEQILRVGADAPGDQTSPLLAKLWPPLKQKLQTGPTRLIGWYHNHPAGSLALSREDVGTHMMYFTEPWQAGIVLGAEEGRPAAAWFRSTAEDGWYRIQLPFYELLSAESSEGGKKRSFVPWGNFKSYRALPPRPKSAGEEEAGGAQRPPGRRMSGFQPTSAEDDGGPLPEPSEEPPAAPATGFVGRPSGRQRAPAPSDDSQVTGFVGAPPRGSGGFVPRPPAPEPEVEEEEEPEDEPLGRAFQETRGLPVMDEESEAPGRRAPPPREPSVTYHRPAPRVERPVHHATVVETKATGPGQLLAGAGIGAAVMVGVVLAGWVLGMVHFGSVPAAATLGATAGAQAPAAEQQAPAETPADARPQAQQTAARTPSTPEQRPAPREAPAPSRPAAPPTRPAAPPVDPALLRFDRVTDSVTAAVRAYHGSRSRFDAKQEDCSALGRALVAVEGLWITYNTQGKPRNITLDATRAARDRSLYAQVDSVETDFDKSACPRP